MKWFFVFFLCIVFVISVKCDNKFNGTGWAYSISYQDESCTTPIGASGISTNNCPPNYSTDVCVNKTITSCVSTPTVHLPSNFAVLYYYALDDSNCDDIPLFFEAVINDQCLNGLKWSYPYIIFYDIDNCTTLPYIKADYGTCINYQKMVLGGAPPPPNSGQDSNRSGDDVFTEITVIIVVVVVVIVFVAALLLYRYCLIGHFVFSISAHYSSVEITQGIAYPVQNDQVVLELPTIYEGHNDIPVNGAPIYPTYTDAITHAPPIVEGVAVVMTTNDV